VLSDNTTFFTFGKDLIDEILDPESDLNTQRLEHTVDEDSLFSFFDATEVSAFIQTQEVKPYKKSKQDTQTMVVNDPIITTSRKSEEKENFSTDETITAGENSISSKIEDVSMNEEPNYNIPDYDILVGKTSQSEQYGVLGKISVNKKTVALDLSETNTISLFGVQGGGKSYTIGTVSEMVLKQFPKINKLPAPLASVIFHYSESKDYEPEFTSMINPNDNNKELQKLKDEFGANPDNLSDVVLLTPKDKVTERQEQYPSIEVLPISFNSNELNVKDWMFLFGAIGNDSVYIKQLKFIMKGMRENINLKDFRANVANSPLLSNSQKLLAEQRIQFAEEYIDDSSQLGSLIQPGRLIIVDLRNEYIEKDEALGLFVVMLNIISSVGVKEFNKFIVFDEAHKYMDNKDLTSSIVTAIREMRHKGVSIMIASQDPLSLPNEIIELSSIVLLHKFNSPQWVKHVQKSITQLGTLTPADLSSLVPGEGYLWATKSTDKGIMNRPVKIFTRPRVTKHGGETIKAN
ncbi:MAG: ATP-binding protein, partial [Dysgonamonadaceae bacterium]|nr:ATP-binding protein [Dysgonamonadaceae bacterium]